VATTLAGIGAMVLVVGQTGGQPTDPWDIALQYGPLGLVVVAIVWRKWLVPGWALEQSEAENDRLRTELATVRQAAEDRDARAFAALEQAIKELADTAGTQRRPPL
jgi:hypothetical protein